MSTETEWRMVPVTLTAEMKKAGGHANSEWLNDNAPIGEVRYVIPMDSIWRDVLAVAPTPPAADPVRAALAELVSAVDDELSTAAPGALYRLMRVVEAARKALAPAQEKS